MHVEAGKKSHSNRLVGAILKHSIASFELEVICPQCWNNFMNTTNVSYLCVYYVISVKFYSQIKLIFI